MANMAEIERAALSAQCLSGRCIPDLEVLRRLYPSVDD